MSVLGDVIRLPTSRLEGIRADPSRAYDEVTRFWQPERVELDWEWKPFGTLFEAAGFFVNPFRSGTLFPDEETAFGANGDSRSLDPNQVVEVAARLERTSFASLTPLLRTILVEWRTIRIDNEFQSPTYRQPLPPSRIVPAVIPDERFETYRVQLASRYEELTTFYRVASRNNECTIFWAA
jgi:hypothetical protein